MHLHCMLSRECPKLTVAGEQDTTGVTLRECKGKPVVNGKLWEGGDTLRKCIILRKLRRNKGECLRTRVATAPALHPSSSPAPGPLLDRNVSR